MGCVQSSINDKDIDISVRKKTKILEHIDIYENHNVKRRSLEYERRGAEYQRENLEKNIN